MPRKTRTRKKQSTAKNVSKRVRRAARSISGATKRATQRAKRAVKGVTKRATRTAKRTVNPPATRHPLSRAGEADAVALLKADHKELRRMLDRAPGSTPPTVGGSACSPRSKMP